MQYPEPKNRGGLCHGAGRPVRALVLLAAIVAGPVLVTPSFALEPIDHPHPDEFSGLVATRLTEAQEEFQAAREDGSPSGEDYGQLAMTYHANDLMTPAAQAYRNAMELSPYDARWPYYLAVIKHGNGRFEEAARLLRSSVKLNPHYLPARVRLADALIEQSALQDAREVLEPIVEQNPTFAPARGRLGRVLLQSGEHEAALDHLLAAHELAPWADSLNHQIALALRALGRIEEAGERMAQAGQTRLEFSDPLTDAMLLRSGSAHFWHKQAMKRLASGDRETALELLRTAVEADPTNEYAQVTLAMTLAELGRVDEALDGLQEYRSTHPGNALSAFMLGSILANEGRDQGALQAFEEAHELNPDMIEAVILAGHAAMRLGRYEQAEGWYARAFELTPQDMVLGLRRVAAQYMGGDCRRAMDTVAQMVPLAPQNADVLRNYARVAATCRNSSAEERSNALNASRNLYKIMNDPNTVDTLAVVEASRGNDQAAEELFSQAISQAVRDGSDTVADVLRTRLAQTREGRLVENPWPPGHPLIDPPPTIGRTGGH